MDAGEAMVVTHGQNTQFDGPEELSSACHALLEKQKGTYLLLDFTERGEDEKLGLPRGLPAALAAGQAAGRHRPCSATRCGVSCSSWRTRPALNRCADWALCDGQRLSMVAHVLGSTALARKNREAPASTVVQTAAEHTTIKKFVANSPALMDEQHAADERTLLNMRLR